MIINFKVGQHLYLIDNGGTLLIDLYETDNGKLVAKNNAGS